MSKRIFSIFVTVMMLFNTFPVIQVNALPDAVDLIHNSDNTVRNGVVPSYYAIRNGATEALGGGTIDKIIDNNSASSSLGQTTHHMGAAGSYYQIDLGTIRTITYIKFSMMNAGFTDNLWRHKNYRILLSNDSDFQEYEVVATVGDIAENAGTMPRHCEVDLTGTGTGFAYNTVVISSNLTTTGSGNNKVVTFAGDTKRYRYIRVEKTAPTGMSCDEIVVMGSDRSRDNFGTWTVVDNQEGTERIFSIPVSYEAPSGQCDFDMMLANYDDRGKLTGFYPSTDDGVELTATIPVSSSDVKSIAVALPKDNDYLFIPPVAAYGFDGFNANIGTADSFENSHTVETTDYYFKIDGKAVSPYDLIVAKAVKSDAATAQEAFSAIDTYNWFGAAIANNGYSFKMPFSEEGKYYICVSRYPLNGEAEHRYFSFSMVDPQLRDEAIGAILSAETDAQVKAAVDYAVDTTGIVTESTLLDRGTFEETGIGEVFTDVCQLMADTDVSISEVTDILNITSIVYRLKEGDITLYQSNSELVDNNIGVKNYVETTLMYSYTADVASDIANGVVGVTNCNASGVITYTFTEEMEVSTLSSSNVVIKKNGEKISYSAYKKNKNSIVIDKSILDSNSNYEITFTTGCKTEEGYRLLNNPIFSFSTGEIIDAPYKEGYIIKNVSLGKDVSDIATQFKTAAAVVDGDTASFVLLKDDLVIDLGDYYDVFRIKLFGADIERSYHLREASILANKGNADFSADNLTLFTYPFPESELQKLIDLELDVDEGNIRYFKLKHGASDLLLREFVAYAYVKNEFGKWNVRNFDGAGSYTFTIPISEYAGDGTYYMLVGAYDGDGMVLESKVTPVTAQNGALSASITAPVGTVGINASIVSELSSMRQVTDSITIGENIPIEGTLENGLSIKATDTQLELGVGNSANIYESSRAMVLVVSTDELGVTAEQAFKNMTSSTIENNLVFMSAVKCGNGINYIIDNLSVGKYYVIVTASDIDGNTESSYYKYIVIDSQQKNQLISSFENANQQELSDWIAAATETAEVINKEQLADEAVFADNNYYSILQYTRDMLYPETGDITEMTQIVNIINAATVADYMISGDASKSKELAPEFGTFLGSNFDTGADVEKYMTVLNKVKTQITDSDSFAKALRRCGMLSYMHGGTNDDKVQVLNNYASEFGIDLTYPASKGVTVERAAQYLNCTDASIYYGDNALKNAFIAAADAAANDKTTGSDTITDTSGPSISVSGGGGGGGGGNKTPQNQTDKAPAEGNTPDTEPEVKYDALFTDMAAYAWADEAVRSLYAEKVISGYNDGTFRPENNITRAEFITMLAVATKIQVVEDAPMNFIDVPKDSWFYPYIRIAYTNSLCSGVSDYYFNPNDYITRQDMAVLVYNFMNYTGMKADGNGKTFIDTHSISDYAMKAVESASAAGIINGFDDGSFRAKDNARRVDAAIIISKIMG